MKKLTFFLLTFCVTSLPAQSAEETAIKKAIEEAGNGAYTNDYERWSSHWSEEGILFHYATEAEHYLFEDWTALASQMQENMKAGPAEKMPFIERKNYKYKIDGNLAWVHFDQKDDNRVSKEQRVLEKENGKWKIVNMTAINVSSYEKKGTYRRFLYFSYKPETPESEIQLVKEKFQAMVPVIDGMEAAIWMDSPDPDSPYNHSLLLEFSKTDALKTYEAHPNHQVAIDKWKIYGDKIYGYSYQE